MSPCFVSSNTSFIFPTVISPLIRTSPNLVVAFTPPLSAVTSAPIVKVVSAVTTILPAFELTASFTSTSAFVLCRVTSFCAVTSEPIVNLSLALAVILPAVDVTADSISSSPFWLFSIILPFAFRAPPTYIASSPFITVTDPPFEVTVLYMVISPLPLYTSISRLAVTLPSVAPAPIPIPILPSPAVSETLPPPSTFPWILIASTASSSCTVLPLST